MTKKKKNAMVMNPYKPPPPKITPTNPTPLNTTNVYLEEV